MLSESNKPTIFLQTLFKTLIFIFSFISNCCSFFFFFSFYGFFLVESMKTGNFLFPLLWQALLPGNCHFRLSFYSKIRLFILCKKRQVAGNKSLWRGNDNVTCCCWKILLEFFENFLKLQPKLDFLLKQQVLCFNIPYCADNP